MAPVKLIAAVAIAGAVARFGPIHGIGSFIAILSIEFLLNLVYAVYLYPYFLSPLRKLPGPKRGHFLFGYGLEELGQSSSLLVKKWEESLSSSGSSFIRYLGFFGEEKAVPMTPDAYREIMKSDKIIIPPVITSGLVTLLGDGLVVASGARHSYLKKIVSPAFTPSQQRFLVPSLWNVALHLNDKFRDIVEASSNSIAEINVLDWTNRVTFDMIFSTAWGADPNSLDNPESFYRVFDRNFPAEGFQGLDAILCYVLPIFLDWSILNRLPFKRYRSQLEDRKEIQKYFNTIISQRRAEGLKAEDGNYKDLLSVMLANNEINAYDLMENMMTFTGAGFGTNAASLIWAIYVLGTRPDIQTRLRNEIRSILKGPEDTVTSAEMDAMKYLHCFVMENSRMYPSIHTTWRQTQDTVVLDGVKFPKNTFFVIASLAINRSKAFWGPDADEFVPERWAPDRRKPGMEHNGSFMTYSVGPKSCIGKEYSLRAIKAVLIALVSEFKFEYQGKDPLKDLVPGLTLRPRDGLTVKVRKAEPW
ncbi:cytochrome P450 [Xylogone sp. PMI_703]|nr:cytochrome P450 [Xylogone sp. PMI_703]